MSVHLIFYVKWNGGVEVAEQHAEDFWVNICYQDFPVLVEYSKELRLKDGTEEGQDELVGVDPFSVVELEISSQPILSYNSDTNIICVSLCPNDAI